MAQGIEVPAQVGDDGWLALLGEDDPDRVDGEVRDVDARVGGFVEEPAGGLGRLLAEKDFEEGVGSPRGTPNRGFPAGGSLPLGVLTSEDEEDEILVLGPEAWGSRLGSPWDPDRSISGPSWPLVRSLMMSEAAPRAYRARLACRHGRPEKDHVRVRPVRRGGGQFPPTSQTHLLPPSPSREGGHLPVFPMENRCNT